MGSLGSCPGRWRGEAPIGVVRSHERRAKSALRPLESVLSLLLWAFGPTAILLALGLWPNRNRHANERPNRIMGAEPNTRWPVSVGTRGAGKIGENLLAWCVAHGWNDSLAPRAHDRYAKKRFTRGALRHRTSLPLYGDASRHPAFPSFHRSPVLGLRPDRLRFVAARSGPVARPAFFLAPGLRPDRDKIKPV
jgi:hypothetical protein